MFGYVLINKPEMKFKEFDVYRSFYCGLCEVLREKYGNIGRMSLSYDMTFLSILLTGLYEPDSKYELKRCVTHPIVKHRAIINETIEYAADMNVLLAYEKCMDDWNDEKKIFKRIAAAMLKGKSKSMKMVYKDKIQYISDKLEELHKCEEKNEKNLDKAAGIFGNILGEIYAYRNDEWREILKNMGYYLGKFIYFADAYEDIDKDIKENNYNPLITIYENEDFEETCHDILKMLMAQCSREFEKLPVVMNVEVLRNIIYSGVFTKYDIVRRKRENYV